MKITKSSSQCSTHCTSTASYFTFAPHLAGPLAVHCFQVRSGALVSGLALQRTQSMRTCALNPALLCNRAMRHGPCNPSPVGMRGSPDQPNVNASPPDIIANQYAHSLPCTCTHGLLLGCTPSACHPAGRQSGPAQPVQGRSGHPPVGQSPHTRCPSSALYIVSDMAHAPRLGDIQQQQRGHAQKKPQGWGAQTAGPAYATCNRIRNCARNCKLTGQTGNSNHAWPAGSWEAALQTATSAADALGGHSCGPWPPARSAKAMPFSQAAPRRRSAAGAQTRVLVAKAQHRRGVALLALGAGPPRPHCCRSSSSCGFVHGVRMCFFSAVLDACTAC